MSYNEVYKQCPSAISDWQLSIKTVDDDLFAPFIGGELSKGINSWLSVWGSNFASALFSHFYYVHVVSSVHIS